MEIPRTVVAGRPFADGSVSIGLYLTPGEPLDAMRVLERHARLALSAGFDGVTLPEHHGTQPGYVTNPVLVATHLLAHVDRGWVAAAPTLASLRPAPLLAEDLAWASLLSGGRFGAAFGAGYDAQDFAATEAPFEDRMRRFRQVTAQVAHRLRHDADDDGDEGIRFARRMSIPLLIATKGQRNVEHAARIGAGLFLPPLPVDDSRALVDRYTAAGGAGPVTITRWVWLGTHPDEGERALNQGASGAQRDQLWLDSSSVIRVESGTDQAELAGRLSDIVDASGGTNLNVRVRLPGIDAAETAEQIERVGEIADRMRERTAYRVVERTRG